MEGREEKLNGKDGKGKGFNRNEGKEKLFNLIIGIRKGEEKFNRN